MSQTNLERVQGQLRKLRTEQRRQTNRANAALGELFQAAAEADPRGAYWAAQWLLEHAEVLPPTRRALAVKAIQDDDRSPQEAMTPQTSPSIAQPVSEARRA